MHRRGFIGSVIGTLVGGNLFFGEEVVAKELEKLDNFAHKQRLARFIVTPESLLNCRLFMELESGERIYAPPIGNVIVNREACLIKIIAQPIKVNRELRLAGRGAVDEDRRLLVRHDYITTVSPGDTIKLDYSIQV